MDPVQNAPLVQAYFTNGFMISGARVMGSVALLPRGMLHWRVSLSIRMSEFYLSLGG